MDPFKETIQDAQAAAMNTAALVTKNVTDQVIPSLQAVATAVVDHAMDRLQEILQTENQALRAEIVELRSTLNDLVTRLGALSATATIALKVPRAAQP